MDPIKLKAVSSWPTPTKVKNIQEFLGFCNFYRQFVKNYSTLACLLFDLTKKDMPFLWGTAPSFSFLYHHHGRILSIALTSPWFTGHSSSWSVPRSYWQQSGYGSP